MAANLIAAQGTVAVQTTEVVLCASPSVGENNPQGVGVVLLGAVTFTAPTAATGITLRLRQGVGTTGTQIGAVGPIPVTAGDLYSLQLVGLDTSAFAKSNTAAAWSLTAAFTAATASANVGGIVTAQAAVSTN